MPLLSQYIENRRFRAVLPYLNGDILDLGCGYGRIFRWIDPSQSYLGLEGNEQIFTYLLKNFPQHKFIQFDLDRDQLTIDRQFDTILILAVIEHLKQPSAIIKQIQNCLKSDGKLIITTPTPFGNIIHRFGSMFNLFNQQAVEEHEIIFTYKTLKPLINSGGLKIDTYRKFLLSGNQLFICTHQENT